MSFLSNEPKHPGLSVKKMQGTGNISEARASQKLRMTFEMAGPTITLRNVGHHDQVLKKP